MEAVKNSGTFTDISCPRLLAHLHLSRFGGTLRVSQHGLLKLLYFQAGEIAMASSNDQGDHLAPILIRAGKLKTEQLELARKSARPGTSLARVLVQMGFLTSGELFAGARQQLRQIVGSVLGLTEANYEIQSDYFPREITSLNVDTREMLLDLIRDLPDRSFVLLEVGSPDTVYSPAGSYPGSITALRLPQAWKEHAGRLAAPLSIHEFGQLAGLDDFAASKVVYGLRLLGLVEPGHAEEVPTPVMAAVQRAEEGIGRSPSAGRAAVPQEPLSRPPLDATPPAEAEEEKAAKSHISPLRTVVIAPPPEDVAAPPQTPPASPQSASGGRALERLPAHGEPIRLEFKGPLSPPPSAAPSRPASPWGILSILTGIAVLACGFGWFVFLRGPSAPSAGPSASIPPQSEPVGPSTPPEEARVQEPAAGGGTAVPPQESAQADPSGVTDSIAGTPSSLETDPSAAQRPPSLPPSAGEQVTQSPAPAPAGAQEPDSAIWRVVPAAPSFDAAARFEEGRNRLDRGEYRRAAEAWLEMTRQEKTRAYTLQIAIACQEETLRRAAARTRGSGAFYVVPFPFEGKACYRLCWGGYEDPEEAEAAKTSLPEFFLKEGGNPVVVSLSKLTPREVP